MFVAKYKYVEQLRMANPMWASIMVSLRPSLARNEGCKMCFSSYENFNNKDEDATTPMRLAAVAKPGI
ncbi:hypothetical protein D5086_014714 [Populus alba]|uniref:Uncharacterized protein n=1 Tax=Populus alba TaxID=43335 RepID=A0ACC4C150_POPAL